MAKLSKKKKLFIGSSNLIFVAVAIIAMFLFGYFIFEFIVMG